MANQKLSTGKIVLISIVVIVVLLFGWAFTGYNTLVQQDEMTSTAWSDVQSQYKRRSDLIPNLVNTVKGYAKHESSTLENLVAARAKATQVTVDADDLTPEKMRQNQEAQGELSAALGKLLAITENYPDLKANQNFGQLQAEIAGTENRINESRLLYNKAVQEYNTAVRKFPKNILASMFGFEKKTKFEASDKELETPNVSFE